MYQVFRNKRVALKGQVFESFEKARQALRKYIRQQVAKKKLPIDLFDGNGWSSWDDISRNPCNYTNAGFHIYKVR